ncbi:MAG: hypothetical protein ACOYYU_15300 [Chloroflexota bacterium]
MKIQIDPHTLERAEERGANIEEMTDVIENGFAMPAKKSRLAKWKVYPFEKERLGKFYKQKRVEVIYIIEHNVIVTVTVYVFYGEWKAENASTL